MKIDGTSFDIESGYISDKNGSEYTLECVEAMDENDENWPKGLTLNALERYANAYTTEHLED